MRSILVACSCFLLSMSARGDEPDWIKIPDAEFGEVLAHCVLQMDANMQHLSTWEADFSATYFSQPEGQPLNVSFSGHFSLDNIAGWYRVAASQGRSDSEFRALSTDELHLELPVLDKYKYGTLSGDPDVVGWSPFDSKVAVNSPPAALKNRGLYGEPIYPMRLYDQSPRTFRDQLNRFAREAEKAAQYFNLFESATSGREQLLLVSPNAARQRTTQWQFRAEHAFHLSHYAVVSTASDNVITEINISYQTLDNVVSPVAFKETRWDDAGERQFSYSVSLQNVNINAPLPANEFSLERLGMVTGDRIRNHDSHETWKIVQDNRLLSVAEFEELHSEGLAQRTTISPRNYLLIVNVALMVAFCLFYLVRKLRRLPDEHEVASLPTIEKS